LQNIFLYESIPLGKRYSNDIEQLIQESEMRPTFSEEGDTLPRLTENPFSRDAKLPIILQMVFTEFRARQFTDINTGKESFRVL
jgi:hypothetical protein